MLFVCLLVSLLVFFALSIYIGALVVVIVVVATITFVVVVIVLILSMRLSLLFVWGYLGLPAAPNYPFKACIQNYTYSR